MQNYEWDVFISYRRGGITKDWMPFFLDLFPKYLDETLVDRDVRIYWDINGIENGDNWKNNIKNALATSRCLVSILAPTYFKSEWCTKEMAVIYNRQIKLGYTSVHNPGGLIIPITIHDGDDFPSFFKDIQMLDCNNYCYSIPLEEAKKKSWWPFFENDVKKLVLKVAKVVQAAPAWKEEWVTNDWLEVPNEEFLIGKVKQNAPKQK
jgi:hypothetical protein